jgi:hypothetical protein
MTITGACYEIAIDVTPRSYRDRKVPFRATHTGGKEGRGEVPMTRHRQESVRAP